jgi:polyisoprenoid-binding protein YceI
VPPTLSRVDWVGNRPRPCSTVTLTSQLSRTRNPVGRSLPSEAVGTSKKVSGTIVLDATHARRRAIDITVDLTRSRATKVAATTSSKVPPETNRFPTATFVPQSAEGLPSPLPTSGSATFQLNGDLTVHASPNP